MGWLDDVNAKRIHIYSSGKKKIYGTVSEFLDLDNSLKFESGESFKLEGLDWAYSGFEPVSLTMATRVGGEGSDRQISSMKKSFRQRFMKHEIDDVREKHGRAIDESLMAGEIGRRQRGDSKD